MTDDVQRISIALERAGEADALAALERLEDERDRLRSTLNRMRGLVAGLEDGIGVNGMVQQPWIDEAYRTLDEALGAPGSGV